MVRTSLCSFLLSLGAVHCFRISSKTEPSPEPLYAESSLHLHTHQRSLDPPYPDHTTYEAIFAGIKNPVAVDCTQPGIICKFPLVVLDKEVEAAKPVKSVQEIPIIIKGSVTDDANVESRDSSEDKEEVNGSEGSKVKVIKGSLEVENIDPDETDNENTWILEKNTINRKYKIPVKIVPSRNKNEHNSASVFPLHHDFYDHFSGGDPYHFLTKNHGNGWTPLIRAYPSVHNYPTNNPCQPPVYHHPPPCSSGVVPTRKPTINIDDKIDKEAE